MQCVYINLDGQTERRAQLEANFEACRRPGWRLTRIPAVDAAQAAALALPGSLRDVEKAVVMSHRKAIAQQISHDGHTLILEDDALFGPESCERIESAAGAFPEDSWDMLFTDVTLVEPYAMTRFFSLRRELVQREEEMLVPLREFRFVGCSSYLVNRRYKQRWLDLLQAQAPLDQPIDLYLRDLINSGEIRAFVTFPFVTSLSAAADRSQSQANTGGAEITDAVWNAFRRFCWLHRDIDAAMAPVRALPADFADPEAQAFAQLLAAALSDKFVYK